MECNLTSRMVIVLGLLLMGPGLSYGQKPDSDAPQILATVNGTPISRSQLEAEVLWYKTSADMGSPVGINTMEGLSDMDFLGNLIDRQLLVQEAHSKQLHIPKRSVDDALAAVKARFPNAAAFVRDLSEAGLDESLLKERLATGLLVQRLLLNEIVHNVRVGEGELYSYYKAYPEDFILQNQTRALHILVAVKKESERGAALLKIETIALKLSQGADFAALAMEYSDCPTRAKGGDLGYFTYDQVIPAFGDAVFALRPGQTSGIVETPLGYHLIKVVDRIPSTRLLFKDVREKIDHTIRLNKENRAIGSYLADLEKRADIVRYPVLP